MEGFGKELARLKEREDAVVLAHYYVDEAVQAEADFVGDSYYLAKAAAGTGKSTIVFCGVRFMGESAKILNPARRVLLPDPSADCAMAHMADPAQVEAARAQTDDLAVVCYINSTAQLKAVSDVCVTSSNAVKIVAALPQRNILFIPDDNLGSFVQKQLPEKRFHFLGGHCPVHTAVRAEDVAAQKRSRPRAAVLTHPECRPDIRALSDFVGSTAEIIARAEAGAEEEYIVCTEPGVLYDLRRRCPGRRFYPAAPVCGDMKRVTPERVLACLREGRGEVTLSDELAAAARRPLERMLELAK